MDTEGDETTARAVGVLAHDHSKIMRNLIGGIDEVARREDLAPRPHTLERLARSMAAAVASMKNAHAELDVEQKDEVLVAGSCVELAALDRAAFNVLNNAVARTRDAKVQLSLATLGEHLRVAVSNAIEGGTARLLAARLATDEAVLYQGRAGTDGARGLGIVAELVDNAYGVLDLQELVRRGYVGTAVVNDTFISWLHWPLLAATA